MKIEPLFQVHFKDFYWLSFSVFAPSWFVNFLYDRFGISAFGYDTMQYFEGLVRKALKDRMETSEPGHDFVQTMADSMREVKKSDPDALKDDAGRLWSKKGNYYIGMLYV